MTLMLFLSILTATAQERLTTADEMYDYVVNSDHLTATIIEYNGSNTVANILQTIDGLLVTAIGEAAFFNKGLMGQLIIPSGVRRIEQDAFNSNYGLTWGGLMKAMISVSYGSNSSFTAPNKTNGSKTAGDPSWQKPTRLGIYIHNQKKLIIK